MKQETCFKCGTVFGMGDDIYRIAIERREQFKIYCPNGHAQYYRTGETPEDKLRRERDRLLQEQAHLNDCIAEERAARDAAERRLSAARGQLTKIRARAGRGICPCCNRTFGNVQRHMATRHPDFASAPLKVIEGGAA